MDPIITSAVTSFVTAVATNSSKAPLQTLDDLWYLAFGRINKIAELKRARNQLDVESYKNSIAEKVLAIDEENLQEPSMSVVGPALEASKYYIEEETLREMFAKVIAAAMDKSKSTNVHHSFVEIIKQLSPDDAKNMTLFKQKPINPIVQFVEQFQNEKGYDVVRTNVFSGHNDDIITGQENATSVTNLSRLGLVSISYEENFTEKSRYELYKNSTFLSKLKAIPNFNQSTFDIREGIMRLTPLGDTFIQVCL